MTTAMIVLRHLTQKFPDALFPRLAEWYGALVLVVLGSIMLGNDDLMSSSRTAAYDLMRMIWPQSTWATIMILAGGTRLIVLFINGAWRKSPHLRWLFALLSMFFWMQLALSTKQTMGALFGFSLLTLALDFANMLHAARDARRADDAFEKSGAGSAGAGT